MSAGEILANVLADFFKKESKKAPVTVLAIPRGGVIIGDAIASKFSQSEFDILIPRKLGAPNNPELAIGAVMQDRTAYYNERLIQTLHVSKEYLDSEIDQQVRETLRRISLYRNAFKPYNIAPVQVITTPSSFGSVGQFYEDFHQVTDEEVKEIARKWGLLE